MKKIVLILLLVPFVIRSQSLNLLPDPGFEDTITCDIQYPVQSFKYWYNPTNNTPDAIVYCNYSLSLTISKPHSGYGAALFFIYYATSLPLEGREYIASSLKKSLLTNKKYCIDYYAKPVKGSKYGCNSLGVYFGVGHQYYNTSVIPLVTPQSDTLLSIPLTDTSKWFHYIDSFVALGGETDIMIGNFKHNSQINTPIIDTSGYVPADGAYFVFDDVSLYEMSINSGNDAVTCPQNLITTIGEANSDTAFKNYYWYDASNNLIDSTHAQINVNPTSNTFYIEEKRMCGQSFRDTVFVNVTNECPEKPIIIPNILSPNDDGLNDTWQLQIDENYVSDYKCTIYNRYGTKLFESTKPKEAWTGHTTSGMPCSEGVYYYIVEFTNSKQEKETHRGYLSLFR